MITEIGTFQDIAILSYMQGVINYVPKKHQANITGKIEVIKNVCLPFQLISLKEH
jgi:hypothetical protein